MKVETARLPQASAWPLTVSLLLHSWLKPFTESVQNQGERGGHTGPNTGKRGFMWGKYGMLREHLGEAQNLGREVRKTFWRQ